MYNTDYNSQQNIVTDSEGFVTSQTYVRSDYVPNEEEEDCVPTAEPCEDKPPRPVESVLIFQLAVCIIIAAAAFVIKTIGGSFYENIRNFYYTNINNSVITEFDGTSSESVVQDIINETEIRKNND